MVGDDADQGGDNVVDEETKGDDQTGCQTWFIFFVFSFTYIHV